MSGIRLKVALMNRSSGWIRSCQRQIGASFGYRGEYGYDMLAGFEDRQRSAGEDRTRFHPITLDRFKGLLRNALSSATTGRPLG